MINAEIPITVIEGNDPLLRIKFNVIDKSVNPPTTTPYDFTGVTDIEFIIKSGVAVPENDATVVVYRLSTLEVDVLNPATDGVITVQVTGADLSNGTSRYRVDVLKAAKRETLMAGPFIVKNL